MRLPGPVAALAAATVLAASPTPAAASPEAGGPVAVTPVAVTTASVGSPAAAGTAGLAAETPALGTVTPADRTEASAEAAALATAPDPVRSARAAPADRLPVTVSVESLEPRDIRLDSTLTVVATLRNAGTDATGPLRFRLQRGSVLTTRNELRGFDTNPPPTSVAFAPAMTLSAGLEPGQATRMTYRTPAADLAMTRLGVYPVAFVVQSAAGETLGRVQTLLPHFPATIDTAGTRVALLWPLLDRPHRLTGGRDDAADPRQPREAVFQDDLLHRSVAPGGRLDRLLSVAEQVTGSIRLTLVIDPETIEELDGMTAGYRVTVSPTRTLAGQGGPAAVAWLARLKRIARQHLVVAVPYADPDLVALERGGLAALARFAQPDLDAAARILGVAPTTKVAWPADGVLTDRALDDLVSQGAGVVLLDPAALPGVPTAGGGATPSAASPLPALGGQAVALVMDATLQRLLASGAQADGSWRLAEQRLLSELAMITAERPSDSRTLVLAPPRRWDPPVAYARAVATDLGGMPWLSSVTALDAAGTTVPVDRGPLVYPAGAQRREIPQAVVQQIGVVQALVADFRGALANADANAELSPYGDALRRAGSVAWRGDPGTGLAFVRRLHRQIAALRSQVTMTAPITGVYTLASTDSPLVLTIQNDLGVSVRVRIRLDTPPGFTTGDVGIIEIPAGEKRSVRVPASVQRTGTFLVRGQLTTPGQGVLGQAITLSVRSRAYGGLALGITGLAFAVLVGAVLVRLIRQLRRPDPAPPATGTPADRSRA